jgi:hypothetical protein
VHGFDLCRDHARKYRHKPVLRKPEPKELIPKTELRAIQKLLKEVHYTGMLPPRGWGVEKTSKLLKEVLFLRGIPEETD